MAEKMINDTKPIGTQGVMPETLEDMKEFDMGKATAAEK